MFRLRSKAIGLDCWTKFIFAVLPLMAVCSCAPGQPDKTQPAALATDASAGTNTPVNAPRDGAQLNRTSEANSKVADVRATPSATRRSGSQPEGPQAPLIPPIGQVTAFKRETIPSYRQSDGSGRENISVASVPLPLPIVARAADTTRLKVLLPSGAKWLDPLDVRYTLTSERRSISRKEVPGERDGSHSGIAQ